LDSKEGEVGEIIGYHVSLDKEGEEIGIRKVTVRSKSLSTIRRLPAKPTYIRNYIIFENVKINFVFL
jgi:hypothetical protein